MWRDLIKFPAERGVYGLEGIPSRPIPTSPDVLRMRFSPLERALGPKTRESLGSVGLGQSPERIFWQKSGVAQTHEIRQVIGELRKRNIFAASTQPGTRFTPTEALNWAVNWVLRNRVFREKQLHAKKPYDLRYATPKYIEDFDYYKIVGGAISAARYLSGRSYNVVPRVIETAGIGTYNKLMFGPHSWIKAGESWDSIWSKVKKVLGI